MSLPKLTVMKHELSLPSTGKKVTYRPFLVKEEKILMMAMQGGEATDIIRTLRDIIESCVESELDVKSLTMFDIEYVFLQLRARSVGDKIPVSYTLEEICEKTDKKCQFDAEVNIDVIYAVLHHNIPASFQPDYWAEEIDKSTNPCWIVYPWEEWHMDQIRNKV